MFEMKNRWSASAMFTLVLCVLNLVSSVCLVHFHSYVLSICSAFIAGALAVVMVLKFADLKACR